MFIAFFIAEDLLPILKDLSFEIYFKSSFLIFLDFRFLDYHLLYKFFDNVHLLFWPLMVFFLSLSPPQPKTMEIFLPKILFKDFIVLSKASGVCA